MLQKKKLKLPLDSRHVILFSPMTFYYFYSPCKMKKIPVSPISKSNVFSLRGKIVIPLFQSIVHDLCPPVFYTLSLFFYTYIHTYIYKKKLKGKSMHLKKKEERDFPSLVATMSIWWARMPSKQTNNNQ